MRQVWSAINAVIRLGVTAESSVEHAQQVTQTNGAALCAVFASSVACVTMLAMGLYRPAALAAVSLFAIAVTFVENLRGHPERASMWLIITIDVALVAMALTIGAAPLQTLSYFACGLPFFLFSTGQWRALLMAVAITAGAFFLLTWPGVLPAPRMRANADDLRTLGVIAQTVSWLALLFLVISFAVNRDRVSARLRRTLHRTQVASAAKSAFLAHTSHELRTPMGAILGYADLLLSPRITDQERSNFVRTIRRNGRHLLELVDQLLDHAKIEAGQLDIACASCSPERIVADVQALMEVRATTKGLKLGVEYETRIPEHIETDELRVRQILVNLIGNAIKFTESGRVSLVVSLDCDDGQAELCFSVIDEGPGIPAERLPAMFNAFTQADMSTQRNYGGTGLGLAISAELAELLGGRLDATSTLGEGSTFTFTLALGPVDALGPLVDGRVALEPTVVRPRTINSLAGARILIAEDGIDNQRLMELYLRQVGAKCVIAANGARAVEVYRRSVADNRPFDVVLMDMQMPEMDGYQATRKLRELGCEIPIIALTAHAMVGAREECMRAGCDGYFAKPIDFDGLFTLLQEIMAAPDRPADELRAGLDSGSVAGIVYPRALAERAAEHESGRNVPAAAPPELDASALFRAELAELNRDFARRLPERVAELRAAVVAGDYEQLRFLAHRLRGTAGTYGMARVSELAGFITNALDEDRESATKSISETINPHLRELADLAKQVTLA